MSRLTLCFGCFFGLFMLLGTYTIAERLTIKLPTRSYAFFQPTYYLSYVPKSLAVLKAPFYWKKDQWLTGATYVAGATAAYAVETDVNNWIVDHESDVSNVVGDIGYVVGHPLVLIPFTSATYTWGYLNRNIRLQRAGLAALESLMLAGGVTKAVKMMAQRKRPSEIDDHRYFDGPKFSFSESNQSFPSGHSALAWATATIFYLEFNDKKSVTYTSYGLASFVSISRCFDNAHWVSDVLVGSAIGYYVAKYTYDKYVDLDSNKSLVVTPLLGFNKGFKLIYSF